MDFKSFRYFGAELPLCSIIRYSFGCLLVIDRTGVNSNVSESKSVEFLARDTFRFPTTLFAGLSDNSSSSANSRKTDRAKCMTRAATSIDDNWRKQRNTKGARRPPFAISRRSCTRHREPDSAIARCRLLEIAPVGRSTSPWNTHKSSARAYVIPWRVYIIHSHRWKGRQPYYVCRGLLCPLNV